ncbi:MAG: CotH kinase family protein [Clostridia bacterium]|nr:CotH kinase family protein [Clostridia bacterium]
MFRSAARRTGLVAVTAAMLLTVFSSCVRNPDTPPASLPGNEILAFTDEKEAADAIYRLQGTKFETGLYEKEDLLAFENAAAEAVRYLRRNKDDEDYLERCTELYRALLTAKESMRIRTGDTPRVYIYCMEEPTTEGYVPCSVYVADRKDGNLPSFGDTAAQIRIRGNSTAAAEKKPFNIILSSDREMLGMEKGSKWALLANHFDKTLLRNKLALDLAMEAGCFAALDSRMAEVYVNGKLNGLYLVCEPVTDGKHRTGIDLSAGDFMVERVKNWAGEEKHMFYTSKMGLRFDVNYGDDRQAAALIDRAEAVILSGDEETIWEILDVDSFASMVAVQEMVKDCDLFYGNCHLCWKDGKLYCGPMWDMDLSMGNVSVRHEEDKYRLYNNLSPFGDGSGDSANGLWADGEWFGELLKCAFFRDLVVERFRALDGVFAGLYADGGEIDRLMNEYGNAMERNYTDAGWKLNERASPYETRTRFGTYEEAVSDLRAWLQRRHTFLKNAYGF